MDLKSFILIHFCFLIIYFSHPKTCQQSSAINAHDQLCVPTTNKFATFLSSSGANVSNIFGQEYHINSSKSSVLEIAWTGENYDQVVLLTASNRESGLYIWDTKDDFKKKRNITNLIHADMSNSEARLHLHKHPLDPKMIYVTILKYNGNLDTDLHISNDSGLTFHAVSTLNFTITQSTDLIFHPSKVDLILFLDSSDSLHLSRNRGYTWVNIANDTRSAKWGQSSTCQDCIFINHNSQITVSNLLLFSIKQYSPFMNTLMRSLDYGSSWTALKEHIFSFGLEDNFTYVSVYTDSVRTSERKLQVSLNDGEHWSNVRLPGIDNDQFYSILDSRDGQIFIHVDDSGDTGRGTLYVSDTTGLVFSAVLRQHLFPNYEDVTDFYRVLSMKGVYITNQIMGDDSVRTVISYNRGVEWLDVPRPQGAPCVNEDQPCFLQIHNRYSKSRGLRTAPPLSVPNAVGIIMVHGHVADSLQTDDPDVFISNDGGYNWYLGLEGPHHYEIADNGGLLVAVPANTNQPKVIKFSTDVGRCWSTYKFTDENITFTGLLTTPTNEGSTVAIWGFSERKALWHTFVFNFSEVVKDKCKEGDYETWVPTSHLKDGCLLGSKDTFLRHRSGAWCLNGAKDPNSDQKGVVCPCTADDYGCDYGYKRDNETCVKDPSVTDSDDIHICFRNRHERYIFKGYHKVPGDVCQGGYQPQETVRIELGTACDDDIYIRKPTPLEIELKEEKRKYHVSSILYILLICAIVVAFVASLVWYVMRFGKLRRPIRYKYASIRSDDIIDDYEDNISGGDLGDGSASLVAAAATTPAAVVANGRKPQQYRKMESTSIFDQSDDEASPINSSSDSPLVHIGSGHSSSMRDSYVKIDDDHQPMMTSSQQQQQQQQQQSSLASSFKGFIHPLLLNLTKQQAPQSQPHKPQLHQPQQPQQQPQQPQQPQQQYDMFVNDGGLSGDARLLDSDADLLE